MDGLRIGGQLHYVMNPDDFIDLVAKYMGTDAERYLQSLLSDYECHIKALHDDINTLEAELADTSDDCK